MNKWNSNFKLGDIITVEQKEFFDKNGVIVFRDFLTPQEISLYLNELHRLEHVWLAEGRDKINGVPLKFGKDEQDNKTIQRLCFTSLYSDALHNLLGDERLKALIALLGPYEGRIAENEKDGLVINNYINIPNSTFTQMGWHTDSPRDLFLGQKIMPMLNVGIHLDTCLFENGGLRVLPGTHKQNILQLLFGKKYFVDYSDDPREVGFDIFAGDLTVHDGRTWHRVKQSPLVGEASRRRVMYVPIITGKFKPKHEKSKTPFYHRFTSAVHH
ncbi:MAG: phytanoyl-CoA dioxygenase [Hydrotalea flava]|uniref:phytanoyl-CoA dioxygenase family protein n=1 Tax=Hydrotalea TaxID=1004300 RepID=UPI000944481E|nr:MULTISPECIES: phytanoyl-CoA dioxygenase family protein [Hydrotalea]MBY0347649.1 phytanoyl-CoA dioxygenase family protein [Hydrotalea flava]NIM34589.1 phytanoyl-CoA dioxygenase [Hydrotalea flava]NIM37435.1 phytanoyl-CoA dioxygenase [Hydrotalea flava]NIN03183.1 phytanoyl-CoA dioxygenase [Hydrotalea flava]NIN14274.1 phytanoyl-CoA dioxygenase [Hydrotalea flava]